MDAFYCSVELLDDPSLQGKPFAVSLQSYTSTVLYSELPFLRLEAGCSPPLPTRRVNSVRAPGWRVRLSFLYFIAPFSVQSFLAFVAKKLCPDLILLKSNFERYSEMSDKVMDIFERYDPTMLAAGCDEGYLK